MTFTATGNFPGASATGTGPDPILLTGFFSSVTGSDGPTAASSGSLTTSSGSTLNQVLADRPGVTGDANTLALRQSGQPSEPFSTSSAAFAGSVTFDLTGYGTLSGSSGGDIYVLNSGTKTLIGTYQMSAVPEPSTYGLLAGGAALLYAVWRRRPFWAAS